MPALDTWLVFAGAALLMALSPGPNMVYLISRSLCQGAAAGLRSWLGVVLGFTVHHGFFLLSGVIGAGLMLAAGVGMLAAIGRRTVGSRRA